MKSSLKIALLFIVIVGVMTINVNILLHPKEQPQLMEKQLSVEEPITSNAVEKEESVLEEKKPTVEEKSNSYLFIGDSRFVGMEKAISTDKQITWIDKVGARHDFYWQNRDRIASMDKNTVVVYELGVNDLNSNACIHALDDLASFGFKKIFLTTTPINEEKTFANGYSVTNNHIALFNNQVVSMLPNIVQYIDTYRYLSNNGIETIDGLHYKNVTYQMWFNFIVENAK